MRPAARQSRPRAGAGRPTPAGQKGFTLLEVMVALTITGMALGGLFSIIAGNKQLAWRSEAALLEASQARNMINFSQLNDTRGTVEMNFTNSELLLSSGGEFETPERKTQPSRFALRQYEVLDENGELVASGSYWVELDFPE